jgi:hypothetical protein
VRSESSAATATRRRDGENTAELLPGICIRQLTPMGSEGEATLSTIEMLLYQVRSLIPYRPIIAMEGAKTVKS